MRDRKKEHAKWKACGQALAAYRDELERQSIEARKAVKERQDDPQALDGAIYRIGALAEELGAVEAAQRALGFERATYALAQSAPAPGLWRWR